MFEATAIMFVYVETPLHAGTGRGLGGIELPIQRERVTGYPVVHASSLKGRLRAEAKRMAEDGKLSPAEFHAIFGPEPGTQEVSEYAAALALGDARILLFPVRSLAGVFAWITSPEVLARFLRDARRIGLDPGWDVPDEPGPDEALVSGQDLLANNRLVLEEFTFAPRQDDRVNAIAQWLAEHALPTSSPYDYWRQALPRRMAVLHRDAFRDFVTFGTEVVTRVRLTYETKTVAPGALWTEEYLPADTLLYAWIVASPTRVPNGVSLDGAGVLQKVKDLGLTYVTLGGDETVGRGIVALRFVEGGRHERATNR